MARNGPCAASADDRVGRPRRRGPFPRLPWSLFLRQAGAPAGAASGTPIAFSLRVNALKANSFTCAEV